MNLGFTDEQHALGECGDVLCVKWRKIELTLDIPHDYEERQAFWLALRIKYIPWQRDTFCPSWTLAEGVCDNCEAETLVVRAGKLNLCLMWCLNTGLSFYPTGESHPSAKNFLKHAKDCPRKDASTLHSWSLTSKYTEALKTAYIFSSLPDSTKKSSSTSLSSAESNPSKKSSSASPLPNLVLSSHQ
jgi:hypothetical protein